MKRITLQALAGSISIATVLFATVVPGMVSADSCPIQLTAPGVGRTVSVPVGTNYNVVASEVSATTSVLSVNFMLDGNLLGQGVMNSAMQWGYNIPSTQLSPGTHSIMAMTNLSDGSNCQTGVGNLLVQSPANSSATLNIAVSPASFDEPTYYPQTFTAHAGLVTNSVTQDVTGATTFQWMPTLGYITSGSGGTSSINFNSGPTTGSGTMTVTATYQPGNNQPPLTATANISLNIFSPVTQTNANATSTPSTSNSGSTETTNSSGTSNPDTTAPTTDTEAVTAETVKNPDNTPLPPITDPVDFLHKHDTVLYTCMAHAVGSDELKQLQQTNQRLPFTTLEKADTCLEAKSNIVPSYLAPVDPVKVATLPVVHTIQVSQVTTAATVDKHAIVLSGTAAPGKTVLIYVFSEPLVLLAKADSNGKWTYTLTDPLQPGNHQAYVTVAGDDAKPVRSDAFGFAVAEAPKTATNPLGLSFAVEQKNADAYFSLYIGAAIILVIVAGAAVLVMIRRHAHHLIGQASAGTSSVAAATIEPVDEGKQDVQG